MEEQSFVSEHNLDLFESMYTLVVKYSLGLLMLVLILISITGNLMVCVAIYTERRLRKIGNLFLVSLALADLFVGLLVMSFSLANDLLDQWIFGQTFCRLWIAFDVMCCTASILNLCAISTDRFLHIKDPYNYSSYMNRKMVISIILLIWSLSALISFLPLSLGWHQLNIMQVDSSTLVEPENQPVSTFSSKANSFFNQNNAQLTVNFKNLNHESSALIAHSDKLNEVNLNPSSMMSTNMIPIDNVPSTIVSTSVLPIKNFLTKKLFAQLNSEQVAHQSKASLIQMQIKPDFNAKKNDANKSNKEKCILSFSPLYAVVSSCISFYLPCIVMVALYTRLYLYARKHVKNIRKMCKPAQIQVQAIEPGQMLANKTTTGVIVAQLNKENTAPGNLNSSQANPTKSSNSTLNNDQCHQSCAADLADVEKLQKDTCNNVINVASTFDTTATSISLNDNSASGSINIDRSSAMSKSNNPINCNIVLNGVRKVNDECNAFGFEFSEQNNRIALNQSSVMSETSELNGSNMCNECKTNIGNKFLFNRSRTSNQISDEQPDCNTFKNASINPCTTNTCDQRRFASLIPGSNQGSGRSTKSAYAANTPVEFAAATATTQKLNTSMNQHIVDHKAAITIGIIMGTFLICWVPFFFMNIILSFCNDCVPGTLFQLLSWLGWANSALNPIIYSIFNTEFRDAFCRILGTGHCNKWKTKNKRNGFKPKTDRPADIRSINAPLPSNNSVVGHNFSDPESPSSLARNQLKYTLSCEPINTVNPCQPKDAIQFNGSVCSSASKVIKSDLVSQSHSQTSFQKKMCK